MFALISRASINNQYQHHDMCEAEEGKACGQGCDELDLTHGTEKWRHADNVVIKYCISDPL